MIYTEWIKHKIEVENLNKFYQDYLKILKKNEADLSQCYCIWKYKDESIMYFHSINDFIINYTNIIAFAPIVKFTLYQPKFPKPANY